MPRPGPLCCLPRVLLLATAVPLFASLLITAVHAQSPPPAVHHKGLAHGRGSAAKLGQCDAGGPPRLYLDRHIRGARTL